jgi:beta-glucosidase
MGKWQRYQYLPLQPLGDDGRMVTGSREHIALSRKAATEGMVLLKNENKALPLVPGEKVALFGKACADYVKGGGGSGDVTVSYVRSFCAAMEEKASQGKLSVFEPLHNFYTENIAKQRAEGKLPGLTDEPELPADLLEQATEACDTAVISINRFSGEGWDRKAVAGDFYLSENEQTMVDAVCDKFSKVIVVLNVGGMVDSSWFKDNAKIQAVLLAWQGGMEGASAQADILCGEANPSGKLVDTFAASFDDYPSSYNFS